MSKHTPGPWYVGSDDAHDCPPHKDSGLALVDTGRHSDWPIARLCEWNNARLIAAAQDMLDALTELIAARDDCAGDFLVDDPANAARIARVQAAWAAARAVLAKIDHADFNGEQFDARR